MKKDIIKKVQVNLPLRMADEYLDTYLKLGFNPEIGIDWTALDTISIKKAESIGRSFRDKGLKITMHGPFMDLSIASPDPEIRNLSRKRIYSVVDFIKALEPESIVFHPGYDFRRYEFVMEEWMGMSCEFWGEFALTLAGMGVCLNVENVYERGPLEIKPIVESVFENGGGFCFDTGHHYAFGEEGLEKWLSSLGKYIKEIHFHDNDGKKDLHLPPGKGKIDFNHLISFFNNCTNLPQITFEPHREEDLWPCFKWMENNNVFR